jgi:glycosyltransferase involved in cell wall biosynthesis
MCWRVLLVLETSGGGSGRHVIDLARGLSDRGHEVHVVYSGTRIEQRFANEIRAAARLQHTRINMRRAPHPSDLLAIKRLRAYLARCGPFDIVHGHGSKGGAVARIAAIGCHAIRVYTPHGLRSRTLDPSLNPLLRPTYAVIERLLCRLTDGIILVSEEERDHAVVCGLSSHKLFVVQNGIEPMNLPKRSMVRRDLGLDENTVCIGFVGRLVPLKAPQRLVVAFARLASRFPHLRLVIVGDGPLAPKLHQLAGRLGLNRYVSWLDNAHGSQIMPAFDIFVMPSLCEAFPYVLIEAAYAGLPIVATPVGGTSAIIQNAANGFLINDTEDLAQTVARLVEDPSLCRRMGETSRRIARTYTVQNMVEKTCAVYEELLSRRAARGAENNDGQGTLSARGLDVHKLRVSKGAKS